MEKMEPYFDFYHLLLAAPRATINIAMVLKEYQEDFAEKTRELMTVHGVCCHACDRDVKPAEGSTVDSLVCGRCDADL